MSTLPVSAPTQSKFWTVPHAVLSRVAAAILTAIDVIAEAQQMAREAHERYPFVR